MFKRIFGGGGGGETASRAVPSNGGSGGTSSNGQVASGLERLDATIELLEKREAVLEKKMEQELAKAKAFMEKKNKTAALACMKRKKLYEDQMHASAAQRANMETMRFAIQSSAMNREVLEAQRRAARELEGINRGMDADKVEEDMDRVRDAMEQAKTVQEALTQPLDDTGVDDDELLAELDAELAGEAVAEDDGLAELRALAAAPSKSPGTKVPAAAALDMPSVPSRALPAPKRAVAAAAAATTEDDDALAALEAELNA